MASSFQKFKVLHGSNELFLLPNAWDARSAILFQENQFPAIGTSSAAVANSLGYEDGENMPFTDYLFVVRRILSSIDVPLTVDIEMGYGKDDDEIATNIVKLAGMGVAGINIEDSVMAGTKRSLKDPSSFARTIRFIRSKLEEKRLELFINVRCDTYILNVPDREQETVSRLKTYNSNGADGIFLPCISKTKDIEEAVKHSAIPLNVMCIPGIPGVQELNRLGVKRVSMGPFMFQKVYAGIGELTKAINVKQDFSPILP